MTSKNSETAQPKKSTTVTREKPGRKGAGQKATSSKARLAEPSSDTVSSQFLLELMNLPIIPPQMKEEDSTRVDQKSDTKGKAAEGKNQRKEVGGGSGGKVSQPQTSNQLC